MPNKRRAHKSSNRRQSLLGLDKGQKRVVGVLLAIIISAWGTAAMTHVLDISVAQAATLVSAIGLLAFLTVIADG